MHIYDLTAGKFECASMGHTILNYHLYLVVIILSRSCAASAISTGIKDRRVRGAGGLAFGSC